jgi:hypothetical protein
MTRLPARPQSPALLLGLLLVSGCGDGEERYRITDVRTVPDDGPSTPLAVTEEQRFAQEDPHAGMGAPAAAPSRRFELTTPEGWKELPPAPMREHGWQVGADGRALCTLSLIEGSGGGLLANVNRWRRQMSLPPIDEAALAALPTTPWLGVEARLVELDGRYVGMEGGEGLAGARLLGLVATVPAGTAYLKMTGPAGVVEVEKKRFHALAASMRLSDGAARAGPARPPPEPPSRAAEPGTISWTAPKEWVEQGPRPMRLVTFAPAGSTKTAVHVSRLAGRAGGLRMNVDRWFAEMGKPAPTDAELAALPRGKVLGGEAVFVEIDGAFRGMSGEPLEGAVLLGMVLEREAGSVFVKMVGPADEVRAERDRFRAFAESLRE